MKKILAVFACAFALSGAAVASSSDDASNSYVALSSGDTSSSSVASATAVITPIWTTAYYAGWRYSHMPHDQIDFRAMTHIAHAFVMPKADGTLDSNLFEITPTRSAGLIQAAHSNNVKVLISIGGENSGSGFRGAMLPENRSKFITNLVTFATTRGYDGIDIDMEPITTADQSLYIDFIRALRVQTNARLPRLLLTCAVSSERADLFVQLQNEFDQINIMTYDMSGAWPGWQTWHHTPLRDSGLLIGNTSTPFPSIERIVNQWRAKQIKPSKIGIGAAFYGVSWPTVNGPQQPVQGLVSKQLYYYQVQSKYTSTRYRWHVGPEAAYLSVDEVGTANDEFISYENERALRNKVLWARQQGLGGLIIWELANGYLPNAPVGQKDPLLQAVRAARAEPLP